MAHLRRIVSAAVTYKNIHAGHYPRHLIDLLPSEACELDEFYVARPEAKRPIGWLTNRSLLENYADYIMPSAPDPRVLVLERPGLWPDGSVAVGFSDGTTKRLSASEFRAFGIK